MERQFPERPAAWSEPGHRRRPQAGRRRSGGATAVVLSGDRDEDAALTAGLHGSEPGPVLDFICRPSAGAMFAALAAATRTRTAPTSPTSRSAR